MDSSLRVAGPMGRGDLCRLQRHGGVARSIVTEKALLTTLTIISTNRTYQPGEMRILFVGSSCRGGMLTEVLGTAEQHTAQEE
jgi:hypothetical protein